MINNGFTRITFGAAAIVMLCHTAPAHAQSSMTGRLSRLLTDQRPSPVFIPDVAAATQTRDTVAGLFLVELTTVPMASSAGGFVYRLNPGLAVVERASDAFGPFYSERVLRNSRGHSSISITFQSARFTSLQGASLTSGTFPTNAARDAGQSQPFSVDTLRLVGSYGVTDRLSIGGAIPIMQVRFDGDRMRTTNGEAALQASQSGLATGLGDVAVHARYVLTQVGAPRGLSVGTDLVLPTGRQSDLLGAGKMAARFLGIGSWEEGPLAVHLNGTVGVGGMSRELSFRTATTLAVTPRVTVVGEVMGRRLSALSRVQDVYQPHPLVQGIETMRWLPADRGVNMTFFVVGAKWNLRESWLLNTNLLIRASDAGLRARITPAVVLDYDFLR
jgi:hypothetical protein